MLEEFQCSLVYIEYWNSKVDCTDVVQTVEYILKNISSSINYEIYTDYDGRRISVYFINNNDEFVDNFMKSTATKQYLTSLPIQCSIRKSNKASEQIKSQLQQRRREDAIKDISLSQSQKPKYTHGSPPKVELHFKLDLTDSNAEVYVEEFEPPSGVDRMSYNSALLIILGGQNSILFPAYSLKSLPAFTLFDKNGNKIEKHWTFCHFSKDWIGSLAENSLYVKFDEARYKSEESNSTLMKGSLANSVSRSITNKESDRLSLPIPDLFVDNVKTDSSDRLYDMLHQLANLLVMRGAYHHCLFLIQSSGYGKTKACITLVHRLQKAVYLVCNKADSEDKGFDLTPCVGKFMKEMDDLKDNVKAKNKSAAAFIYKICLHADRQKTMNLYEQQFEGDSMNLQFSRDVDEITLTEIDLKELEGRLYTPMKPPSGEALPLDSGSLSTVDRLVETIVAPESAMLESIVAVPPSHHDTTSINIASAEALPLGSVTSSTVDRFVETMAPVCDMSESIPTSHHVTTSSLAIKKTTIGQKRNRESHENTSDLSASIATSALSVDSASHSLCSSNKRNESETESSVTVSAVSTSRVLSSNKSQHKASVSTSRNLRSNKQIEESKADNKQDTVSSSVSTTASCKVISALRSLQQTTSTSLIQSSTEGMKGVDEKILNEFFVIIFDEAVGLMDSKSDDAASTYRCLRRVLDKVTVNGKKVIGIFLSTNTNIPQLLPVIKKGSTREEKAFFDIMYDFVHTGMFRDKTHKGSRCSFFIGRPLWYNKYLFSNGSLSTALNTAMKMLCNNFPMYYKPIDGDDKTIDSALFMCRAAISSSPPHGSDLVAHHLATLQNVHIVQDGKNKVVYQVGYLPEPILCEASILLTHGMGQKDCLLFSREVSENFLSAHLKAVNDNIMAQFLSPSKGDLGEVVGAAALFYTMDYLRLHTLNVNNKLYNIDKGDHCSTEVSVVHFLMALTKRFKTEDELSVFKGYFCNFTHFVRIRHGSDVTVRDLQSARLQNCAFYAKEQATAIDGLIPIYKKVAGEQFITSCLKVQFKNYAKNTTLYRCELNNIFWSLRADKSSPDLTVEGGNPQLLGAIVVGVGRARIAADYNHIVVTNKSKGYKVLNLTLGLSREDDFYCLPDKVRHELVRIASINMPLQVEQSLRVLNGSLIAENRVDDNSMGK